ncbi:MAG: diguanylate cyclase, partial [Clostridia bacterium]|nr:diguanylate cyclase [Clostridia bacterium]
MLNIRRKRLSFKTSIVLAIVLLVCVFVSMLFGFLQTNQIKSDYYRDIAFSTEYLKQDIYEVFARADNALRESGADPNSIPEPFYRDVTGFVFITSDAQAVFASKEPVLNLVVNTQFLSDIIPKVESSQDGFYRDITTLRDIFTDEEIRNDSVYFSIKNEDGIYVMAILDMKRVFSEVRDYGFESIRLLTSDVTFSCSDIDARLSQDFHAVIEADTKSRLLSNDAYADMAKIGRDKFIVSISERDQTYSALRLVVTKSPSELNSFIGIQTTHFLIEDITYVAIFSAAFVLLLLILMKDEGGFQFFNIRNSNYAIKVSSAGKILWKNNLFGEKFDYHTISDCIVSAGKNLSHTLALGKPVVLDLEDKDGDKHYLLMNVIRFAKIFRLVGADLTAEISTYRSLSHTDKYDNVTDLGMEWVFINQVSNLIAKGKGIKGALALMRLSNLSMLKIMLGEHLYKQLLMLYAGSLKREFAGMGELFVLKNGDFLLFNTNDSANTLINKLPAIMERLRQPVRLNENNIQLDAKLGVIVLNSRDANITANSLLSNAQRALEYAINSVKQNHYVLYPTSFSVSRTNFRADGVVKMMIDNGEIEAYFQPQYSLSENKIVGFEALCRIIGPKSAEINVG